MGPKHLKKTLIKWETSIMTQQISFGIHWCRWSLMVDTHSISIGQTVPVSICGLSNFPWLQFLDFCHVLPFKPKIEMEKHRKKPDGSHDVPWSICINGAFSIPSGWTMRPFQNQLPRPGKHSHWTITRDGLQMVAVLYWDLTEPYFTIKYDL